MVKRIFWLILLVSIVGSAVSAQSVPALVNGGLEEGSFGPYLGRRGGEQPIYLPSGWDYWLSGNTEKTNITAHPGPLPDPKEGSRALRVDCGFNTCPSAIFQQISNVPVGTNVQASAYSFIHSCGKTGDPLNCGASVPNFGAQSRIGIDPNGGGDPNAPEIVWSAWIQPHDVWQQQSVSATTTGTTVTIFLFYTQSVPAFQQRIYWDSVAFSAGGSGGSSSLVTPGGAVVVPPTAIPYVPFAQAQGAQPDGSIVHTIVSGDTIDSIAVAYGVTRQDILNLNNLKSATFIQIGQKLLIRPAPTATALPLAPPTLAPTATLAVAPALASNTPASIAAVPSPTSGAVVVAPSLPPPATIAPQATEQVVAPTTDANTAVVASATLAEPTVAPPTAAPAQPTLAEPTVAPASATPNAPAPTAPVAVATTGSSDPSATSIQVCAALFNDANQNRIQEPGEALLAGGILSLSKDGQVVSTHNTDGASEPFCFSNLQAGNYIAKAIAPSGYGLTTPEQLLIAANPGPAIQLGFGAAQGVQSALVPTPEALQPTAVAPQTAPQTTMEKLSGLVGIVFIGLAGIVLVGGIGLALVLRRR